MKKIYTLLFAFITLSFHSTHAQCPTPGGMLGVPISLNGNCFINIQFAIPYSNVSIYNGVNFVAQGVANASGNVVISYPCASNPITSLLSIVTSPTVMVCNNSTITQLTVLPVKLTSFKGILSQRKTVVLNWETALELDNEKYVVQRSSDGVNYAAISEQNSNGSGVIKRTYTFEDISFPTGTAAFYRLQQIDFDGKTSYSKVVYINDKKSVSSNYSLFPNPSDASNNTIQIKGIPTSDVSYSNIRITDLVGRNIGYKITGANAIEMDSNAPSGIYIVRIKDKTLKLIKER